MSEAPFMQFYVAEYLGDTMHLTTEQHGAYLLLLMAMWRAGGALPNDPRKLARIARIHPPRWKKLSVEVLEFFDVDGDQITHGRVVMELEKVRHKSQSRAQNGRLGGIAKSLKNNETAVANAKQTPKHSSESYRKKDFRDFEKGSGGPPQAENLDEFLRLSARRVDLLLRDEGLLDAWNQTATAEDRDRCAREEHRSPRSGFLLATRILAGTAEAETQH